MVGALVAAWRAGRNANRAAFWAGWAAGRSNLVDLYAEEVGREGGSSMAPGWMQKGLLQDTARMLDDDDRPWWRGPAPLPAPPAR
jgi:hypothetical protein